MPKRTVGNRLAAEIQSLKKRVDALEAKRRPKREPKEEEEEEDDLDEEEEEENEWEK